MDLGNHSYDYIHPLFTLNSSRDGSLWPSCVEGMQLLGRCDFAGGLISSVKIRRSEPAGEIRRDNNCAERSPFRRFSMASVFFFPSWGHGDTFRDAEDDSDAIPPFRLSLRCRAALGDLLVETVRGGAFFYAALLVGEFVDLRRTFQGTTPRCV